MRWLEAATAAASLAGSGKAAAGLTQTQTDATRRVLGFLWRPPPPPASHRTAGISAA